MYKLLIKNKPSEQKDIKQARFIIKMLKYDLTKTIEVTIGVVLLWVALLIQFFYPEIFSDYDFLVYIFFSLWLLRILYINKKPPQKTITLLF